MFRINLLPKEVLERRRYEGWYRWVFILAIGLVLIVGAVWLLLTVEVNSKQNDLQGIAEQSQSTNAQAEQLSIFQNKEEELQKRQVVAQTALAGRVNVGQVANDISLVLPDEVWLDLLTINQDTGVVLSADTPRTAGESTDVAYKSVAKTLVRLNELPELYDVWLNTATNSTWNQFATRVLQTGGTPNVLKVVAFQASGKVIRPDGGGSSSATATPGAIGDNSTVGAASAAQNAVNQSNSQSNAAVNGQ